VQQPIQQAERAGVVVKTHTDNEGINIFYNLHLKIRKQHGAPIQPKSFFYNLKKDLFENNLGFVLIAYIENKPVSAVVFLQYNKKIIYKYSASDYNYIKYKPNNIVLASAIKYACENGFKIFDFGISDKKNDGLIKFKSGWGTVQEDVAYTYLDNNKFSESKTGRNKILKTIIQKSPKFVCRILGELFYKYAG